jgi:hypothetical protein
MAHNTPMPEKSEQHKSHQLARFWTLPFLREHNLDYLKFSVREVIQLYP